MTQSVVERAKAFGELANPKQRRRVQEVSLPSNNLQSVKYITTRNAASSTEKESSARYNLSAALSSSARSFGTPQRQGNHSLTTKMKLSSPKGVEELESVEREDITDEQHIWKTEIEKEVEDALIGIQVLRHQVEQMKSELAEVRKKKKDFIIQSKEEYQSLVNSLKKVELLREENCKMVDEINQLESTSCNY